MFFLLFIIIFSDIHSVHCIDSIYIPGICVCGSGVGTFLLAPLTSSLCVSYGWRGSNRVMAALCLACSLCGLVMVPRKKRRQGETRGEEEQRPATSHCGLFTNTSFLLIMLGNIPFVMAIYTSYTYLPAVSNSNTTTTFAISYCNPR